MIIQMISKYLIIICISRFTCRGLFERHKLLFSFQMCAKILEAAGKLNMDEYNFFLRGGVVGYLSSLKCNVHYDDNIRFAIHD